MKHLIVGLGLMAASFGVADILTLDATQVGGFYAEGSPDNHVEHQNYFVGYGTTPGSPRTSERRSFFYFDMPVVPGEILSAKLSLKLMFSTSLIFGKGPGMPPDPIPDDEFETFQLGVTTLPASMVTSLGLPSSEWGVVFDSFDDIPVADPKMFFSADELPLPAVIEIHLDSIGLTALTIKQGSDLVLTGWMPSWSHDDRLGPDGKPVEGSELIFGFSDVPDIVPMPTLTIEYAPVPEPGTMAAVGLGIAALLRRRRINRA